MLDFFRKFLGLKWQHGYAANVFAIYPALLSTFKDRRRVFRAFQIFEALALAVAGSYAVLISAVLFDFAWLPIYAGLGLLVLGWRRWVHPAEQVAQWSWDALIALGLVFAAVSDVELGVGNGPFLFLIATLAITFPALLKTGHALVYALALLFIHFYLGRLSAAHASPWLFGLRGALVATLCLLSGMLGYLAYRSRRAFDFLRTDLESGVLNEHGWLKYGAALLKQCEQSSRNFSFALLPMQHDWYELAHKKLGVKRFQPKQLRLLKSESLADMASALAQGLPAQSIVGRNARGDWVLIVPDWSAQQLHAHLLAPHSSELSIALGPAELDLNWHLTPIILERAAQESLLDLHTRAMSQFDHPPSSR